jgi:hypothetical protein
MLRRAPLKASLALLLALTLAGSAGSAAARSPRLDVQLGLFNRLEVRADPPETLLRWDPARSRLASDAYLAPGGEDIAHAVVANARFKLAVTRELFIAFDVDTGAIRPVGRRPARTTLDFGEAGTFGGVPTTGWDDGPTTAGRPTRRSRSVRSSTSPAPACRSGSRPACSCRRAAASAAWPHRSSTSASGPAWRGSWA